jgi:uncharacterized protein (DUF433 family)
MIFTVRTEAPPLRQEPDGALRVADSRVLLELVVRSFRDGATPEAIVQRYSTLSLPDVYAVIAYYLRHPDEVAAYLDLREQMARESKQKAESRNSDLGDIRARLLTRRHA